MRIKSIVLSFIFSLTFVGNVCAQSGSIGKKIDIDDDFSIEFKEIKRTGQGALMVKYNVEKKATATSKMEWVNCKDSKVTDLVTKAVYHNMTGEGTASNTQYFHSTSIIKCWNMISEPPASLKSAVFIVADLAPVEIEIP